MQVNVINENNVEVSIDPPQTIVVEVDQGKQGRGITNISYQQEGEYYYLVVTYTDGTTEQLGPLIITGAAASLLGGTAGAIAYQTAPDNTGFIALGAQNQVLVAGSTAPQYTSSLTGLTINNSPIGNVTKSTGGFTDVTSDSVQFNTASTEANAVGKVYWDAAQGTLDLGLLGGNVISRIGQSLVAFVTNAEATTITKGQAVYLYGAQGDRATVKLAYNTSDATSAKTFGIVAENIGPNQTGFVMCQGVLEGLNLSAFTAGNTLYLGATPGSLTATKPSAPNHLVYMGVVERANAGNGQLYIKVQNGYELEEIHDVQIVNPQNGQTIFYDASTSLWKNANITPGTGVSVTNGPASVTINNTGVLSFSGGTTGLTPATSTTGAITLGGTLAITHGGTGQTTANDAFNALAPSQTGNSGKYLKTDGTNTSWDQLDISTADITGTLAVTNGGTGATNAVDARTNLNAASQSTTISAGTGLTGGGDLSANRTISIANTTVTAGAYGSASNTLTATVNAQGQLTALSATPIAIANTQVSGLGTMSTQNSNSVTVTGGSITGITDLAIADGGTGASTAADARANLGLGSAAVLNAGVANGVATLDSGGTVPLSQLPASIQGGVSYQGSWDAATNTPTLTSSVGSKGYYYVVSVAGSTNLNGVTDWLPGDWAIFNGSVWQKIDNTDAVASVNGYTGVVVLSAADVGAPPTSRTISAGTGLTGGGDLSTNRTISIANTAVSAGSYGSASSVGTFTVNGQGQLTAAASTPIAITNTQVSGLGTMSTQNANSVAITGGAIDGATIGGTTRAAGSFTTLTLTNALSIANGGTGQTTANAAFNALAPSQTGNAGKYLTTDGTNTSWATNPLGTVTSVDVSGGTTGLTTSGGPVTTSGTITLAGTLNVANGGTGTTTASGARTNLAVPGLADANTFTNTNVISVNSASDALRITQTGAGNALVVEDSANPDSTPFVVDASGRVIEGTTVAVNAVGSVSPQVQLHGVTINTAQEGIYSWSLTPSTTATKTFLKSKSGVVGTYGAVSSNDSLGSLVFAGDDGSAFIEAARIFVAVDGTPGTNDMPGRLVFSTTAAGASIPTERMRIDNAGKVGIGVTPISGATLSVAKAVTGATTGYGVLSNGQAQSDVTSIYNNFHSAPSTQATTFTLADLRHYNASQGTIGAGSTVTNQIGFNASSALTGATNNYGFYGNIAAGTGRWNFYAAGTADNYFAGNVGIGTSSPGFALDVATAAARIRVAPSTTTNLALLQTTNAGGSGYFGLDSSTGGLTGAQYALSVWHNSNYPILFGQNNLERMRVDTSGNLLVGTTTNTNTSKLVVNGTISETVSSTQYLVASQFDIGTAPNKIPLNQYLGNLAYQDASNIAGQLGVSAGTAALPAIVSSTNTNTGQWFPAANTIAWSTNGSESMRLTSTGLGIGTSSPAAKLDVNGGALIQGLTVGRGAGAVSTNTAVGASALASNTTGASNAAVGYEAMYANTTGNYNVAFGRDCLDTNTTGSNNTAIGYSALQANTTASNNTAVGYQAGYSNSTGTALNAFGTEVLYANTTGIANAGFGGKYSGTASAALRDNSTGSYNSAFGVGALAANTTASNNTAVGYQAGYSNTTGFQNAFLGNTAGYSNTTGNYQTFVGQQAGYSTTTGSANTFVGNGAGYYVTTGAKNTVLGAYSGNQGGLDIRTASNYIVLSDGDGNPRLYCDSNGHWRNTTTSNAAHVVYAPTGGSYLSTEHPSSAGGGYTYHEFLWNGTRIGQVVQNGTTGVTYATSSDYRLKNTIAPMTGALAKVAALKPVTYKWNADGSDGEGFIAHELAEVCPNAVTGEKDAVDADGNPVYQGIDTSFLVATLTAAIQEQQAIITDLRARVAQLESKGA